VRLVSLRLVAAVGVGCLVAACSTGAKVADKIEELLDEQFGIKVHVTCPDDAKADKGAKFDCVATLGEHSVTYHVVFEEDNKFNADPDGAVDTAEHAAEEVRGYFESGGTAVTSVDCGEDVIFVAAGESFDCDVTSGADTVTFSITVDDEGAFTDVSEA